MYQEQGLKRRSMMSRKPDKAAKRKAKLKARKFHAEQHRLHLSGRIADAFMDLCADVLPEYVDDSKGPDLVGRNILWRMGMVAWNIAVTGRKEIDDSSVDEMRVDAESQKMVRDEINGLVRKKYEEYPELRTAITDVVAVAVPGEGQGITLFQFEQSRIIIAIKTDHCNTPFGILYIHYIGKTRKSNSFSG